MARARSMGSKGKGKYYAEEAEWYPPASSAWGGKGKGKGKGAKASNGGWGAASTVDIAMHFATRTKMRNANTETCCPSRSIFFRFH